MSIYYEDARLLEIKFWSFFFFGICTGMNLFDTITKCAGSVIDTVPGICIYFVLLQ